MRHLHPITPVERFVASGVHRHTGAGVVEHWSVHEQLGGALLIRVDCDYRAVDGRSLLIEAWGEPDGTIERFGLRAYGGNTDVFKVVRADFAVYADYVEIGYSADGSARRDTKLALSAPPVACPVATVFRGLALWQSVRSGGSVSLVTHTSFSHAQQPFDGAVLPAASSPEGCETDSVIVDGRSVSARRWRWPEVPGFEGDLWLDARGAVLRHDLPNGTSISLARYSRRMEPISHD